jgi:hypothetical protein
MLFRDLQTYRTRTECDRSGPSLVQPIKNAAAAIEAESLE